MKRTANPANPVSALESTAAAEGGVSAPPSAMPGLDWTRRGCTATGGKPYTLLTAGPYSVVVSHRSQRGTAYFHDADGSTWTLGTHDEAGCLALCAKHAQGVVRAVAKVRSGAARAQAAGARR